MFRSLNDYTDFFVLIFVGLTAPLCNKIEPLYYNPRQIEIKQLV